MCAQHTHIHMHKHTLTHPHTHTHTHTRTYTLSHTHTDTHTPHTIRRQSQFMVRDKFSARWALRMCVCVVVVCACVCVCSPRSFPLLHKSAWLAWSNCLCAACVCVYRQTKQRDARREGWVAVCCRNSVTTMCVMCICLAVKTHLGVCMTPNRWTDALRSKTWRLPTFNSYSMWGTK